MWRRCGWASVQVRMIAFSCRNLLRLLTLASGCLSIELQACHCTAMEKESYLDHRGSQLLVAQRVPIKTTSLIFRECRSIFKTL